MSAPSLHIESTDSNIFSFYLRTNCHAGSRAFHNAKFGEGTGTVFLEGLRCTGSETSLLDCPMDEELGLTLCDHSDDAGIRCYGTYMYIIYMYMCTVRESLNK